MGKVKVLILSHISELLGGAERSMLDLFDDWVGKHDIEPEFIMREPARSLAGALKKRGWKYHVIDYGFWSDGAPPKTPEDKFFNSLRNTQAVIEIENIIKSSKPDIVMTNSIVCPWAALAAYYQETPHIWFIREYGDLDHGRVFVLGREKTFQDVDNLSDIVVSNSKSLAEHIRKYVSKEKVTTLYTPFKLEEFRQRSEQRVKSPFKHEDSLKLITTNNISPTKGQKEAVEAVGALKDSNVEICIMGTGDADCIGEIKAVAREYGVEDRVHFTGSKPDTLPYIKLADVGIMSSRKEAFGRATFECLATGKPVIGADTGATPEMVNPEVNGYLYEQGNSRDLADKISNYIKNRELLNQHGVAAKAMAEDMMSGKHSADNLFVKVESVLSSGVRKDNTKPINLTHELLKYPGLAKQYIDSAKIVSLHYMAYRRLRHIAKTVYFKLRSIAARVTGK